MTATSTNTRKRINEIKKALRNPYTWPGAYPLSFYSYDGLICHKCVRKHFREVLTDTKTNVGGWNLFVDVVWEGTAFCAECSAEIETAYGPSEDADESHEL